MSANDEVSVVLLGIADLLDLQGERFKPEAYRRAARSIRDSGEDVRELRRAGHLSDIPGVGDAIQKKIEEFLDSGKVDYYERLKQAVPPGVIDMMRMPGVGPKTAARFQRELGIEGPAQLLAAIDAGRLAGVAGFGPKKIENLRKAVENAPTSPVGRFPLRAAWAIARKIVVELQHSGLIDQVEVAGSLRRRRESVGDLDILATSTSSDRVIASFASLSGVREVVVRGDTKCTVIFEPGIQIDLRVVPPESFGAALQYFTGSKDHNVRLRTWAKDRGLKINEYGVYRAEERVAGATEEEVYRSLGFPWIPPEIRENSGELDAAIRGKLPALVAVTDLRGELHQHLGDSVDGAELTTLASEAARRRFEYVGVILPRSPDGPYPTASSIERVRAKWPPRSGPRTPRLMIGAEVRGSELPSAGEVPMGIDYWILDASAQPDPPKKQFPGNPALALPWFVAHLDLRDEAPSAPSDRATPWVGWSRSTGVALEVTPDGLADGLDSRAVRIAIGGEGSLVINAGSKSPGDFDDLDLAVGIARRGWAGPHSVVNASTPPVSPRRTARERAH